ncbi:MAG: hypothetical protein HY096_12870 [Nitrospinae bacterium]|nr:hypothetical protein [Nitrospinota bacterium]
MRKIVLVLIFLLIGCGGGSGSSATAPSNKGSAPIISNLYYSPATASYLQGGGAVTVYAYLDYIDADGDIDTGSSYGLQLDGVTIKTTTSTLSNMSGKTSGTMSLVSAIPTLTRGTLTYTVWVTDKQGNNSNQVTATFTVN